MSLRDFKADVRSLAAWARSGNWAGVPLLASLGHAVTSLLRRSTPATAVIDLGCGAGSLLRFFRRSQRGEATPARLVGLDIHAGSLALAKADFVGEAVELQERDMASLKPQELASGTLLVAHEPLWLLAREERSTIWRCVLATAAASDVSLLYISGSGYRNFASADFVEAGLELVARQEGVLNCPLASWLRHVPFLLRFGKTLELWKAVVDTASGSCAHDVGDDVAGSDAEVSPPPF